MGGTVGRTLHTAPIRVGLQRLVVPLAVLALPLVAVLVYQGGLSGPFMFDDWANLPALGNFGRIDNWDAFWRYITSGTADPTGRPLALLSFLIDANDWPADPARFKYTNALLHAINGLLLLWVLWRLNRLRGLARTPAFWAAVLATALWVLHPLWVSTVLYVVQRQAMLVATWTLSGLLLYVCGRERLGVEPRKALLLMSLGVGGGTLFGVLSKGNGALLPLLTLLLETIVLTPALGQPRTRAWAMWRGLFLWLPSALLLGYLVSRIPSAQHVAADIRPFTIQERLLTESRILWDYLRLLFLPRPFTHGLFNDAYPVSTSLLQPWTTLPAVIALLALVAGIVRLRRRAPVPAFALAFFLAGHLLESTVIPLELYFEHRNYTPALLLFWPLSLWLVRVPTLDRRLKMLMAASAVGLLAIFTWLRADLWGKPVEQVRLWALMNPDSPRAQTQAAIYDNRLGDYARAARRLEAVLARNPNSTQAALTLVSARCGLGGVDAQTLDRAFHALKHDRVAKGVLFGWMEQTIQAYAAGGGCSGLDAGVLSRMLDAAAANPAFDTGGEQQDIHHLRGLLALAQGDGPAAARHFRRAVEAEPRPDAILSEAALLGSRGFPALGLELLDRGYQIWQRAQKPRLEMGYLHHLLLRKQGYWEAEFRHLRRTLQEDANAQRGR